MKGTLDHNNINWFVRYKTEEHGVVIFKTLNLSSNPCSHIFENEKLVFGAIVEFEPVRFCNVHMCEITPTSTCTFDCAFDEIAYARIIKQILPCTDGHKFSKAMGQSYPRKCIVCGIPEEPTNTVECVFCKNTLNLDIEDTCSKCGKSHFENPDDYKFSTDELYQAYKAGILSVGHTAIIPSEDYLRFEEFYKALLASRGQKK